MIYSEKGETKLDGTGPQLLVEFSMIIDELNREGILSRDVLEAIYDRSECAREESLVIDIEKLKKYGGTKCQKNTTDGN